MSQMTNNRKLQVAGAVFSLLLMASLLHLSTDTLFMLYPVFAVNILVVLLLVAVFVWRKLFVGSAVHQRIVYTLRTGVTTLIKIHAEFIQSQPRTDESYERKKTVREITFFLIAQNCMASQHHFAWLYSLLAYKFATDLVNNYIASSQAVREVGADGDRTETSTSEGNEDVRADVRSAEEVYRDHIQLAVYMFKAFLILLVAHHQISRLKLAYTAVTLAYFLAVEGVFEAYLTHILENAQFDVVDGLEQHYVRVTHGLVEMSLIIYFMIWALISNHQILMLVALYTNVYSQGKYLFQNTICAIFAEWSVLAHFEKASQSELVSLDDVCAVCLAVMKKARKTPCKHYFHGHCLRRSLKVKNSCPICSFTFHFFLN